MKNFSTQCMDKMMGNGKGKSLKKAMPCKQTLEFIMQFARVYHTEPALQKELCGFVIN
jgi:hypothetical protein